MAISISPTGDLSSDADLAIRASYHPSGVVVDSEFEIRQFRGDTGWCLRLPQGAPTTNLLKVCRDGMLAEVRAVVREAEVTGAPSKMDSWIKLAHEAAIPITVEAVPFTHDAKRHFAVLFTPRGVRQMQDRLGADDLLLRTERELASTKEYLSALVEKEKCTNEELKSANEEILAANEELLSSNEEIAAAKEETQIVNVELVALNAELESRNRELDRVSSDLTNLLESVQIPMLMLSEHLTLKHLTPAAAKVLNLGPDDLGRTLDDLSDRMLVQNLGNLTAEVLTSLQTKDVEVRDREGRWFSLRIKPCRSVAGEIEGIVIALVDIDALKQNFSRLEQASDYAEAIVQTAPVPLLVLDSAFRVVTANYSFYRHFGVSQADTVGVRVYELGNGQWNAPRLKKLLEDLLPKNGLIENFTIDHEFPQLGLRSMRLNARRLIQRGRKDERILLAINDFTAERQVEKQITAAKDAAEIANQAKSDFLANMSHEIRTPLGAILGYTEMLANPEQSPTDAVHCVTRIRRNIEQLSELIDEILDIAKIEAGKFDVDFVRFPLLPELAETLALLQDRAKGKGLGFKVVFEGEMPDTVVACSRRVRQILLNVAGNALKFTEAGSISVAIGLDRSDAASAKLWFRISDTGCGLTPEQAQRLFLPFSQADNSVTRRFGGTGLGLLLARRLAQALGGDVVLTESTAGKGTTFTCSIGVGDLAGVVMHPGVTQWSLQRRKPEITDWFSGNGRLEGLSLLLVEDGPDNRALMTHFLTKSGARVEYATNGLDAIAKALPGAFDLVLMDIQMPVLDGYEATRRLKEAGYRVPIVALTAHAMRGEREKCLAAGCIEYISKPVKPALLIETVARLAASGKRGVDGTGANRGSVFVDHPLVGPVIPQFLETLPLRAAALREAESRASWAEVAVLAHQMAGAAGSYGFEDLGNVAARIEKDALESPSRGSLAPSLVAFEALCEKALRSRPLLH